MAIKSFKTRATGDINYGYVSKSSLRLLPKQLHLKARVKLARLHAANTMTDLTSLQGNRLEMLKGDRFGQWSIRINRKYRICFRWVNGFAEDVEIVDYH